MSILSSVYDMQDTGYSRHWKAVIEVIEVKEILLLKENAVAFNAKYMEYSYIG